MPCWCSFLCCPQGDIDAPRGAPFVYNKTPVLKNSGQELYFCYATRGSPLRSTYSFRYALPLLQAEIPSVSTWLVRLVMQPAASGSSALISPFTPDLPAAIPPSATLCEVNARVTTLNHRFVILKLFLVVLYFPCRKMSRAS